MVILRMQTLMLISILDCSDILIASMTRKSMLMKSAWKHIWLMMMEKKLPQGKQKIRSKHIEKEMFLSAVTHLRFDDERCAHLMVKFEFGHWCIK